MEEYRIFGLKDTPPQIWEENGGASYSLNVAYLPRWGSGGEAVEQGHRRQEQGHRWRKPVAAGVGQCCRPWAGRRGCPCGVSEGGRSRVPSVAYYSARDEGTGGAGTLEEESLQVPYVPPSHEVCPPH